MQALPSPASCGEECPSVANVAVPGPPGLDAEDGAAGADGQNAYTLTTASFVMPAEGGSVSIAVLSSAPFAIGQHLFVQTAGDMQVVSFPDSTHVLALNLAVVADGVYPDNAAPTTIIAGSQKVVPSGIQGATGEADATALQVANNLSDLSNPATARASLGLGTAAVLPSGTFLQTAANLADVTAATARTNLGLGNMAVQAKNAVDIDGGTIDGTVIGGAVPAAATFTTANAADSTLTGTVTASGSAILSGKIFFPAGSIQSLLAATTILPTAPKIKVVGNGGPITSTVHPTITTPASDGQLLIIQGTDDTNTVELQDDGTSAGTKLQLGSTSRVLGKGDTLVLLWDATDGFWYELNYAGV